MCECLCGCVFSVTTMQFCVLQCCWFCFLFAFVFEFVFLFFVCLCVIAVCCRCYVCVLG